MLLAVIMITPVFAADEGSMELDVKVGFNFMSNASADYFGPGKIDEGVDPAFTATLDFFYYVMPELAVGAGAEYIFNSEVSKGMKIGWTNIYAQAKYIFDLNDDLFNNIYPLLQIGYGMLNLDADNLDVDSNELYWGLGVGTTIKENFVVELLYSNAGASLKYGPITPGFKYSTLQLKVGYKFNF